MAVLLDLCSNVHATQLLYATLSPLCLLHSPISFILINTFLILIPIYLIYLQTHPKMETNSPVTNPKPRRPQSAGIPRSPRLSRSSSGASIASSSDTRGLSPHRSTSRSSSVSLPEIRVLASTTSPQQSINRSSRSATTSPRPSVHRSRSTTKSRTTTKDEGNYNSIPISKVLGSPRRRLSFESREDSNTSNLSSVTKLFRSSSHNASAKGIGRTLTKSPSAWALSPGRPLPVPPLALESPKVKGVSGMLKYFNKQKKISTVQAEEFHQYKIMHNRLIQWRFANAKAEAAMTKVKSKAEVSWLLRLNLILVSCTCKVSVHNPLN